MRIGVLEVWRRRVEDDEHKKLLTSHSYPVFAAQRRRDREPASSAVFGEQGRERAVVVNEQKR
jgi:hypothetical protein